MSEAVEIEYKNLLTEKEYQKLFTTYAFQKENSFTQTNLYFDTKQGTLAQERWGLRVRMIETTKTAEATLKSPLAEGLLETTVSLPWEEALKVQSQGDFPEAKEILQKLCTLDVSRKDLLKTGDLTTTRVEKEIPAGLLVLDENWYGNAHDFELELEVSSAASGYEAFLTILKTLDIPLRPAKNKILRMYQEQKNNYPNTI